MFSPSHFTAVLLFALCASTVFGITQRETPKKMVRYGAYCFMRCQTAASNMWVQSYPSDL
jgi:hypothetical protein